MVHEAAIVHADNPSLGPVQWNIAIFLAKLPGDWVFRQFCENEIKSWVELPDDRSSRHKILTKQSKPGARYVAMFEVGPYSEHGGLIYVAEEFLMSR